jgi:hypothetical protein
MDTGHLASSVDMRTAHGKNIGFQRHADLPGWIKTEFSLVNRDRQSNAAIRLRLLLHMGSQDRASRIKRKYKKRTNMDLYLKSMF